jgi:hypothetical protein
MEDAPAKNESHGTSDESKWKQLLKRIMNAHLRNKSMSLTAKQVHLLVNWLLDAWWVDHWQDDDSPQSENTFGVRSLCC